jgi:iron(III) transport system substrate-binding protein
MKVFRLRAVLVPLVAVAALAAAVGASGAKKPKPKVTLLHPGAALTTLVKKAQAEGTLNFYTVPPDASVRRVAEAFTKRWGVKATWTRFGTAALQDRFGAEAGAGNPGADMILLSNSPWVGFAEQKGWIVGPSKAGIPGWPNNKVPPLYPKQYLTNAGSAIVQLQPSVFMYNKNQVSAGDAPKTWDDLLDPKWKGKIILTDPTSSPAFVDLWWAVAKRNGGMPFLQKLRAQAARLYPGVAPLTQAIASGEAAIAVPGVPSIAAGLIKQGAPIGLVTPPVTNGPEATIGITVKAKHPNAARLFAYFLLTPGGQSLLNADPGSVSIWDEDNRPKGYIRVDSSISQKSAQEIYSAFGVK